MNKIYVKVMEFFVGRALANSDRVRAAFHAAVLSGLTMLAANCDFCNSILTKEVAQWIAGTIAALGIAVIAALTGRDVAAPDEVVDGEAMPEPPSDALGTPGFK